MSEQTSDPGGPQPRAGALIGLVVLCVLAACVSVAAAADGGVPMPANLTVPANGTMPANVTAEITTLAPPAQNPAAVNGSVGKDRTGPREETKLPKDRKVTQKDREESAKKVQGEYEQALITQVAASDPGGVPHYFGPYANWANSPMPKGPVLSVTVDAGGAGYTSPTVQIVDVYETNTSAATATATVAGGVITGITITSGGAGYTAPRVVITDPTGTGAAATAALDPAQLTGGIHKFVSAMPSIPVAVPDTTSYPAGGRGYTSAPTIVIADANGTGAAATAVMNGDTVASVTITGGGSGYSPNPLVTFSGGGVQPTQGLGANAVGRATVVDGVITGVTLIGSDYYEIELGEYQEQLHPDLPPTTLRGYRQVNMGGTPYHSLGPTIVARRDVPVRVRFINRLPTGAGGDLFLPVDTTVMGAGHGDLGGSETYTENRATVHMHGAYTPWISDGTPFQWTTPAGETTSYPQGVSVYGVPDMPDWGPNPQQGVLTFYYTNQQSARLMFYHDHSHGITRLNVYAGEAAGYLVTDQVEQDLIQGTDASGVNPTGLKALPDVGIPLILQDKTFVDASTIPAQDPTWNWGTSPGTAVTGNLWYPHVYVPAQNPWSPDGVNPFGRWPYGPWFWPPTDVPNGPVANPYYDPNASALEPPQIPGVPNPSMAMEAFMDTSMVNGEAYPYLEVEPRAYRFRVLNAADDRFYNLQLYRADPAGYTAGGFSTEVSMVPASPNTGLPANWPVDGRDGGVPNPASVGPSFIQIGTEGGFLPEPVEVPNQPITWVTDPTVFNAGNVDKHALLLSPAERADVIVDFSQYAGQTLILYNDAPAAFPALDARYDYYTGHPDLTDTGGAPSTQAGYGPNTRTVLQIRVGPTATKDTSAVNLANLKSVFAKTGTKRGVFEVSQDPIISPQAGYNSAYGASFPADNYVRIFQKDYTFKTLDGTTVTVPLTSKAIQDEQGEAYDEYGRLSGFLGLQAPRPNGQTQLLLYGYESPPTEILTDATGTKIGEAGDGTQFWKITHNGVDTHPIHWHLVNIQVINRVGWDGIIRPPDATELGWKETLRVNPLEDTIVALRPASPWVPWDLPNSYRPIDPTEPLGARLSGSPGQQAQFFDTAGNPVTVTNKLVNFGWEYVWHCHILAHEEMDMMHALILATPPKIPAGLTGTRLQGDAGIQLTWRDSSAAETGFVVQRASDPAFTAGLASFTVGQDVATYTDGTAIANQTYYYRVTATNTVGDTTTYAAPAVGFPSKTVSSGFSNVWSTATNSLVVQIPGGVGVPTDTNGDGKYDDVNGNGRMDFADVVLFFSQMSWIAENEPVAAFDFNGNGRVDFADIVWLFNNL